MCKKATETVQKIFKQKTMKTRIFSTAALMVLAMLLISNAAFAGRKSSRLASSLENVADPSVRIESWMVSDLLWEPEVMIEMVSLKENALHLESWMLNPCMWEQSGRATEGSLVLEHWMTSPLIWEKPARLTESQLLLEPWMTEAEFWNKPLQMADTDRKLSLENWMLNENIWKS